MDSLRKSGLWVTLLLSLSGILSGCSSCGDTLDYTSQPKGGNRTVYVYVRDCGATAPFVTNVSLLRGNKVIKDGGGNLFVADAGEEADLSDLGAIATEVVWNDNDHVVIRYDAKARVFKKVESLDGLHIQYETF